MCCHSLTKGIVVPFVPLQLLNSILHCHADEHICTMRCHSLPTGIIVPYVPLQLLIVCDICSLLHRRAVRCLVLQMTHICAMRYPAEHDSTLHRHANIHSCTMCCDNLPKRIISIYIYIYTLLQMLIVCDICSLMHRRAVRCLVLQMTHICALFSPAETDDSMLHRHVDQHISTI